MGSENLVDSLLGTGKGGGGPADKDILAIMASNDPEIQKLTTEIDPEAVLALTLLRTIQRETKSPVLLAFLEELTRANIVVDRKRSMELVELHKSTEKRGGGFTGGGLM